MRKFLAVLVGVFCLGCLLPDTVYKTFHPGKIARVAFADEGVPVVPPAVDAPPLPPIGQADIDLLIQSIGGLKGASAMAIAFVIVQILLLLFKGNIIPAKGGWVLVAVYFLSLVFGVLSMVMVGGLSLGAALAHSQTLAAIAVFVNQILKQALPKQA